MKMQFIQKSLPIDAFKDVCRACLKRSPNLSPIKTTSFSDSHVERIVTMASVFEKYCPIKVYEHDKYPQNICRQCLEQGHEAYDFFEMFLHSQIFLTRSAKKKHINPPIDPFKNVCRACLKRFPHLLYPIKTTSFSDSHVERTVTMASVFEKYCSIKIYEYEKYPQDICRPCFEQAHEAYDFFEMFLHSQIFLTRTFKKYSPPADDSVTISGVTKSQSEGYKRTTEQRVPKSTHIDSALIPNDQDLSSTTNVKVNVDALNDKHVRNVRNNTAVSKHNLCKKDIMEKSTFRNTDTCSLHKNDSISESVRRVPLIDASIGLDSAHFSSTQSLNNLSKDKHFKLEYNYCSPRDTSKIDKCNETMVGCSAQNIGSTKNHLKSANVENVKQTYVGDLGSEKENRIILTGGKKVTTSSQQVFGGKTTEGESKNADCFKLTSPGLLEGSAGASVEGNGVIEEPTPQQTKTDFNSPPGTPKLLKPPSLEGFESDVSSTNSFSGSQNYTTEKIFHDHTYVKTKISPQSSYFCRLCDERLEGLDETMDHLESYHLHVRQCMLCPSFFVRRPDLIFHVARHWPNSLTCEKCHLYFRDKESYDSHNEICKRSQENPCKFNAMCHICGKELMRNSLRHHMRLHNMSNAKVKCKVCNLDVRVQHLQLHMRVHGATFTYICRLCPETFSDVDRYRAHISSAHQIRYICEVCGKAYVFKSHLYAHWLRHHKPKGKRVSSKLRLPNRMCEFCGKIYSYDSLQKHAKRCRESQGKPLTVKCRECGRSFTSSKALRLHMCNIENRLIYNCRFCKRTFNNQPSYKKHLNSEHEKGYACHLCDKSFVFKVSYNSHMRAHNTNYVPKKILVNCEFCDKSLNRRSYRKHITTQHPAGK